MVKTSPCNAITRSLAFTMSLILTSCGFLSPAPALTPTSAEPISLRIYTYRQQPVSAVLDIAVKAFQSQHPEVKITLDPISGDPATQLLAMTSTNTMPDIVWTVDALTPSLVDAGLLLDMGEIANVDSTFNRDDIDPHALAMGSVTDAPGLYMIPIVMDNVEMYYNKNLFTDSGSPLPGADWMWDDLIAACKLIQAAHSDVKCLDYSFFGQLDAGWWGYLVPWMRGYGGAVLSADGKQSTFSQPESLLGLQAYIDLWTRHQIATPLDERGGCFISAKCAVMFGIAGGSSFLQQHIDKQFDWDVQRMPAHPQGRYTGTLTYGYAITKFTTHRDLAWEFMKMLVNPDVQRTIALNHAGLPVLKSLAGDPSVAGKGPPANMQVFYQSTDMAIYPPSYPTKCGNFYSGLVQSTVEDAVRQAINGSDVIETFKKVDATIQDCIDSAN
ncbi:MAG TPA: sugar ABC transporter substrate-binding protein [Anaerolineae bacterium]